MKNNKWYNIFDSAQKSWSKIYNCCLSNPWTLPSKLDNPFNHQAHPPKKKNIQPHFRKIVEMRLPPPFSEGGRGVETVINLDNNLEHL